MIDTFALVAAGVQILAQNPFACTGTSLLQTFLVLWIVGLLARGVYCELSARRMTSQLSPAAEALIYSSVRLRQLAASGVSILQADIGSPQISAVGLMSPLLIVDAKVLALLTDDEVEAVIEHEASHIEARDGLRILVASGAASLFIFCGLTGWALSYSFVMHGFRMSALFGALGVLAALFTLPLIVILTEFATAILVELRCDRSGAARAGGEAVASALVKLARGTRRMPRVARLGFSDSWALRIRVRAALKLQAGRGRPRLVAGLTAWLLVGVLTVVASLTWSNYHSSDICPSCKLIAVKLAHS